MEDILNYLTSNEKAFTVIGIILTLLVSGISLFYTVRNNKAVHYVNSITKHRVEWIDKIRKNSSEFISILDTQEVTDGLATPNDLLKHPFGNNMQKLNQLAAEIKLMLNFADELDREIMALIDMILLSYKNFYLLVQSNIMQDIKNGDMIFVPSDEVNKKQRQIDELSSRFLSLMQIYLKSEWNRVKHESKGEAYEKETELFDIEELKNKKINPEYTNNVWKRGCIDSKAKLKRICKSYQLSVVIFVIACIVLICCVPTIIKDILSLFS